MVIDKEAFEESDFTLMAKDDYLHYSDDSTLNDILMKYGILKEKDYLTHSSESNYLLLITYLEDSYYFNKDIPEDITKIVQNNISFKEYILKNNKRRLTDLFTNGSALFFKEIVTIVKFLSNGENYNIFVNYNEYNFEEMARMFKDYEVALSKLKAKNNEKLFDVVFKAYGQLFEAYTLLCVINSIDVHRKQTISKIVNQITESVNMLKYSVKLSEKEVNKVNDYLGKVLYYFTHLSYIDAKGKEAEYLIEEFQLLFERQTDGFNLSKDTDFGADIESKDQEYVYYKDNAAFLLLLLLEKLKYTYKEEEYINSEKLKRVISTFYKNFPFVEGRDSDESLSTFKIKLQNTLVHSYRFTENSIYKNANHHNIIDDFIITGDKFEILNLRTIHHTLLFSDDIEDYKYLHIGETLVESSLIQNDYYEYYKLKTIDIVINYFIKNDTKEDIKPFIAKVNRYIENNKKASHLLSIFSKLYLSIASYYAKCDDEESVLKAKDVYSKFININGTDILKNEYKWINRQILTTFGNFYVNDLNLNSKEISKEERINLGYKLATNYIEYKEIELKFNLTEELTKLTNKILYENYIDYQKINEDISDVITDKLFYGLSAVFIKGLGNSNSSIIDHGYKHFSMKIDEKYSVEFVFPAVYEKAFKYMLDKNFNFIKSNVSNILASFDKSSEVYLHAVTGLENKEKLKYDLNSFNAEDVTFVEILLGSLPPMNLKFGFTVGDNYLSSISNKLKTLVDINDRIYYLGSGRIGILLDNGNSYRNLTDRILNFKIKKAGKVIDTDFTVTVTSANKSEVLQKSEETLNQAILKNKKLLFNK